MLFISAHCIGLWIWERITVLHDLGREAPAETHAKVVVSCVEVQRDRPRPRESCKESLHCMAPPNWEVALPPHPLRLPQSSSPSGRPFIVAYLLPSNSPSALKTHCCVQLTLLALCFQAPCIFSLRPQNALANPVSQDPHKRHRLKR